MGRKCEQCGIAMPGWKPRKRSDDGRLLCNGCHPDGKGPGEGRPVGHHGMLTTASERDPIRMLALQYIAHDSGDGETIYHCPFCGGGNVIGRSDGTVECGFCENAFTVQIQPVHPGAPQTINGEPVEWPGQPEGTFQPDRGAEPGAETGGMDEADPAAPVPGAPATDKPTAVPGTKAPTDKPKGAVPPQFAKGSFITQAGHVLTAEAFQRHLAILNADDPADVLAEVRAEQSR